MSNLCLSAVLEHSQSKGVARLVLIVLADMASDEGEAWPGCAKVARRARISRQNVCRAVKELVDLGELEVIAGGASFQTNLYRIAPSLILRQSQGETVSPRDTTSLTMRQGESHLETQTLNEPSGTLKEEGFLQKLKTNSAYAGIDIDREALRAQDWLRRRAGRRPFDERFFRRWLDRVRPVRGSGLGAVLTGRWQGGAVL